MAKFEKATTVWVPYYVITVSAMEMDALRNLLKYYFEGQQKVLGSVHSVALKEMLSTMDVPGGPLSAQ